MYVWMEGFDFIECFTTTFLHTHSWLNWVEYGWREFHSQRMKQVIFQNPLHMVQLIRYARVCSKYEDFLFRGSIMVCSLTVT